ncbi:4-hydroxy-3-methylbut-2-enyl diphosphate reductase [Thiospirochaeta perfilievii]|uniref:4-hydroxy-3-methylbut-2-enyl diphosphate reductase n=1 Tax=Thiospirochaeta perfilievii TaxID=252967 RepID=A0A5C1QC50_9SPIO|nr:4-hydroxy-3-methylbut-2-enyl diphosphate reductase [Thiospirochaeta perfilievii]QEN04246.1 4-hydroxy-3-methylbut-2-enyl diphosphate reductase [Thiospirochaeta perfilievii]
MRVKLASTLGFCGGVKKAVDLIYKELESVNGKDIFMEGPIIHNSSVIKDLEDKGVSLLSQDDELNNKKVLIRAHGVTPQLEESLIKRGGEILDGTCPIVKSSQKKIRDYSERGYYIVICGDKGHGEVIGLVGYAPNSSVVVGTESDLKDLVLPEKTVLISQTTFSKGEFTKIEVSLRQKCPTLEVLNTICGATKQRQDAVVELAQEVDVIIVVGGLNSSNTKRLKKAVEDVVPTWLIEDYTDIPKEIKKYEVVGVTAGASTPDSVIDRVVKELKSY